MALLLAPYQPSMKLGSGFNTYTHELCVDDAVVRDTSTAPSDPGLPIQSPGNIAQTVIYKTEIIQKMSDLTEALDINGTQSIRASSIANVRGNGNFVNSNLIKESDLNYLVTCKVVNQTVQDSSLSQFNPVRLSKNNVFTEIYGDAFISGYQLGGEFTALISIAIHNKAEKEETIKNANAAFTAPNFLLAPPKLEIPPSAIPPGAVLPEDIPTGDIPPGAKLPEKEPLVPTVPHEDDENNKKIRSEILSRNSVTISVSYTGGGQRVKNPDEDWNFESLRAAAIRFPELVAQTPVPTHAVLTKYTSLRSWHMAMDNAEGQRPTSYDNVKVYTGMLQDVYLDYKNLYKDLQLLALDVDAGTKSLKAGDLSLLGKETDVDEEPSKDPKVPEKYPTFELKKPYPPSLIGLEQAKRDIRVNMNRILLEVDRIAQDPSHALREDGKETFMNPLVFKQYVPRAEVTSTSEGTSTAVNGVSE